ncbi:MAG TPA: DUF4388 domain-containing protein [Candidatus Krumholzibacteria bacterium]|nr:DUF4388 domain-containing protein [Candidatus Krumholzibacteria bacterium]
MALEGQLSDFNLAEILQLISSQQKSGFLNLETTREMVFVFDKGELISTRDRRDRSRDPLESFLRAYGFFDAEQWKHIEYVRANSSLDLTEILVSEGLLDERELDRVLRSVAQEMTVAGMKLRRGRYHFTPTQGTPPGVRRPLKTDVQGLLMEAARRVDEEPLLREALPTQSLTFTQGAKVLPAEALGETGQRVMKLALAGLNLGQIIRQGRTESFVVRDLIKNWCAEGVLALHNPGDGEGDGQDEGGRRLNLKFATGLRSVPMTLLVLGLVAAGLYGRWFLLPAEAGNPGQSLRESQLRAEVVEAARLYRFDQGAWPGGLTDLVRAGLLSPGTALIIEDLGWTYRLDAAADRFTLGS